MPRTYDILGGTANPLPSVRVSDLIPVRDTLRERMERDVQPVADHIAADLGIKQGIEPGKFAFALAKRFSRMLLEIEGCPGTGLAVFQWTHPGDSFIIVESNLTKAAKATVMVHEVVHLLLYTDRYDSLHHDYPQLRCYPRKEFHELIALAVEQRFVEAGGSRLRASWQSNYIKKGCFVN